MKHVWLLRHAKSSWDDPTLADHERPLAPRGHRAASRMGRWARDNDVQPGIVLCSTAVRARATLELVLPGLGGPAVEAERSLYHASSAELIELLRALPGGIESVLLVGHNPGLHDLACALAPPGPEAFPTGALAELGLAIEAWEDVRPGCAQLRALVVPRSLPA